MTGTVLHCGACGAQLLPADRFCERCGAQTDAGAPDAVDLGRAAAVTDAGHLRGRNEDAFHLATVGEATVAVVCDGVSTSDAPDLAARRAADAAGTALADGVADDAAIAAAVVAARIAVRKLPVAGYGSLGAPSCTIVCCVARPGLAVVGWVGDSRAYWASGAETRLLTSDDASDNQLTRWIGADAPAKPARVITLVPAAPGRLVLCSEGFWNYAPAPDEVRGLVRAEATAGEVARTLLQTALERGGRDNITVAVIDVEAHA